MMNLLFRNSNKQIEQFLKAFHVDIEIRKNFLKIKTVYFQKLQLQNFELKKPFQNIPTESEIQMEKENR